MTNLENELLKYTLKSILKSRRPKSEAKLRKAILEATGITSRMLDIWCNYPYGSASSISGDHLMAIADLLKLDVEELYTNPKKKAA